MASKGTDEDGCSPECLLTSEPVKDPYSTDEEQEQDAELRRHYNLASLCLTKVTNSSEFKAEQSYFYQNVHFKKIDEEEIHLEDKSIFECLHCLFEFSSSRFFDGQRGTLKDQSIVDLMDRDLKKAGFKWFVENDSIDWKTASEEKMLEIKKLHVHFNRSASIYGDNADMRGVLTALNVAEKVKALYDELCYESVVQSVEERFHRRDVVRACIESMATFVSPLHYLRYGQCAQDFNFYVPNDLISDNSPLIPEGREVLIQNRPDGVFTFPAAASDERDCECDKLWLIPVQIYGPESEKDLKDYRDSQPGLSPMSNTKADFPSMPRDRSPPKTSIDSLLNPVYQEDARHYITQALPMHCRGPLILDKMAGQHVQQLVASAKQITHEQKSFFEKGTLEVLGIFAVNEYIYFSRLDIEKEVPYFLTGPYKGDPINKIRTKTREFRELNKPTVSFSNFRLDLTIARHRLAFMIFIRHYTLAFYNIKV